MLTICAHDHASLVSLGKKLLGDTPDVIAYRGVELVKGAPRQKRAAKRPQSAMDI